MPSTYLKPTDLVVRYVPWSKLRKNEDETEVYGPLGLAFQFRKVDSYLSVTWCNYFAGDREAIIKCAAEAIRRSKLEVKPKGRFAVAQVFLIDSVLRQKGHKVRFVHEAEEDNPAHAALRRWPNEDLELLERLAEEVWHETFSKEQIDRLPLTSCQTAIGV